MLDGRPAGESFVRGVTCDKQFINIISINTLNSINRLKWGRLQLSLALITFSSIDFQNSIINGSVELTNKYLEYQSIIEAINSVAKLITLHHWNKPCRMPNSHRLTYIFNQNCCNRIELHSKMSLYLLLNELLILNNTHNDDASAAAISNAIALEIACKRRLLFRSTSTEIVIMRLQLLCIKPSGWMRPSRRQNYVFV